jgi:hypothetical protein
MRKRLAADNGGERQSNKSGVSEVVGSVII